MTSPLRGTHLKLEGLRKSFGTQAALRGIDLAVMPRESVQLVDRNECGKSTMLRPIAGLLESELLLQQCLAFVRSESKTVQPVPVREAVSCG